MSRGSDDAQAVWTILPRFFSGFLLRYPTEMPQYCLLAGSAASVAFGSFGQIFGAHARSKEGPRPQVVAELWRLVPGTGYILPLV